MAQRKLKSGCRSVVTCTRLHEGHKRRHQREWVALSARKPGRSRQSLTMRQRFTNNLLGCADHAHEGGVEKGCAYAVTLLAGIDSKAARIATGIGKCCVSPLLAWGVALR
jgi:hypothetical protein